MVVMVVGVVFVLGIVGGGMVVGVGIGVVQVLVLEEEFDGVVVGGDVGFGIVQFVQVGQFFVGDFFDVDFVFVDLDFGVGDDVGGGVGVVQGVLVVFGDIVDQVFVQWLGVNLFFLVVDDCVVEVEGFVLGVRGMSGELGFFGGFQGFCVRFGEECVDGFLQVFGGVQGIGEGGFGEVCVIFDYCFGGGFVDFGGWGGGGCGGLCVGCWCCGCFGFFVVVVVGEGDGEGQQIGGGQGYMSYGGFFCFIGGVLKWCVFVGNICEGVKKLLYNVKDLYF